MSEPHAEPPAADVRSFLPRPGEPVEDYAARLRALHHDLSLVLDAVERGLAAAEESAPLAAAEPAPLYVAEPRRSPPPPGPLSPPRGSARVEVVSTQAPARAGEAEGGGSWSGPPVPEGSAPRGRRGAPMGEGAPGGGDPAAPPPERWGEAERRGGGPQAERPEPWVERPARPPRAAAPWQEAAPAAWQEAAPAAWQEAPPASWQEPPPWTERRPSAWPPPPAPPAEMTFEPPAYAPFARPPRRRLPAAPPLLVAATILGWLVVLALVLALALG